MGNLNDLPVEILLEIITRLPTESVIDCKSVCRLWRYLVSHHPSFRRMHLTRLNDSADSGKLSFVILAEHGHLYYFEYDESHDETPICSIRRININRPFSGSYNLIGSSNGLVCLYGWRDYAYYICNPVTREYVIFPNMKRDFGEQYNHLLSEFGYLPLTNEYKVVELYKLGRESSFIEVAVNTLGSGHGWRYVGRFGIKSYVGGAFLKGALHLVDQREGNVFAFDLTEEKFREHVSPPPLPLGVVGDNFLGVLGGVLYCGIKYYSQITKRMCSDIWLPNSTLETKEQVEQQILGWRKEFCTSGRKPFALTKSGSVLYSDRWGLGIYDAMASTLKKLVHSEEFYNVIPYKNTLVSLKDLGKEDVKIMESAEVLQNYESLFFIQSHQDQIPKLINWKTLWKICTSQQGAGRGSHLPLAEYLTTQGFTYPLNPKEGVIPLLAVAGFITPS